MKIFNAIPHISLGPVRIGAERSEVHKVMGVPEKTFNKAPASTHPTDTWFQNAFQVFYAADGKVEFVEVSGGAGIEVIWFGTPIFGTAAGPLIERLHEQSAFISDDGGYSFIAQGLDVALWRPVVEGPEGTYFATFGLGASGYYA